MKSNTYQRSFFALLFTVTLAASVQVMGQSGQVKQTAAAEKESPSPSATQDEKKPNGVVSKEDKGLSEEQIQGIRRQRSSEEEAADVSYLRNYFENYRLGPEDIISVDVFKLPDYSLANQSIPPDGKINYKLIGPIVLRGRTTEEVQKEIAEKLNEYIIDPKVTVQLVQSRSMKYMVDGDVPKPGIFEMTRRMTIREAIINSGGILPTGDKGKVQIARAMPNGQTNMIAVNFKELEKGKGVDEFLAPGDVVFVPGNRFKTISKYLQIIQTVTWLPMIVGGRRF
ncbi:MAG: polysaccharide export protein [Acidobacteria bacterium]|nr:polysaccharide export protein [Acidobacteriota bacterium]